MKNFSILLFLLANFLIPVSAQTPLTEIPAWTPPVPRTKAWTIFAPKPLGGDNVFKGEAEGWLSDAILKIEGVWLDPIKDRPVSNYVSQVGLNLVKYSTAPKKKYEFIVVADKGQNAFNIGAGRIFINLGLLHALESEDELASVIAHEIGHDAFGHAPKTVTRQMFWMTGKRTIKSTSDAEKALEDLLVAYEKHPLAAIGESLLGWSRFAELEADRAGFYNVFKAGYNPEAMKNVFRRFLTQEKIEAGERYKKEYFLTLLFGSHPPSSQRVTGLKLESNWVKMPAKDSVYKNDAFETMKRRVKDL